MEVSGQFHAPATSPPGRAPEPQSLSGRGEEKNSQILPGLEPLIIQPVAQGYTTELPRLLVISNSLRNVKLFMILVKVKYNEHNQLFCKYPPEIP
jgi:hypothetical protein